MMCYRMYFWTLFDPGSRAGSTTTYILLVFLVTDSATGETTDNISTTSNYTGEITAAMSTLTNTATPNDISDTP